jgi:hypothetical protein
LAIRNILPFAAGALALLALIGIASVLIGRRRRRREQELADERSMSYEPFETAAAPAPVLASTPEPATVAQEELASATPSAFAWGNRAQSDTTDRDERRPGETWVERAYRGPSPSNPSVSLRHRLSRAAFFDKREREAAAGTAEPINTSAGLPRAMIEEQEREPA